MLCAHCGQPLGGLFQEGGFASSVWDGRDYDADIVGEEIARVGIEGDGPGVVACGRDGRDGRTVGEC